MKEEIKSSNSEQASWLGGTPPGNWESLKQLVNTRLLTLFDGAYFGFTGESILMKKCDTEERVTQIIEKHPTRGKIVACNPGAKKVSRFFPLYPEGHSLAIKAGEGYEKINHVEAGNEKLIREVEYGEIFRYIGENDAAKMLYLMRVASGAATQVFGTDVKKFFNIPETAYQVTKEGVRSGLFLVDNKYEPSENNSFFGGGGSIRRRSRATV